MKKKTYTLKIEVTSSSFPNHPHLAVKVAKRMWRVGRDSDSISLQIGTPKEMIQKIAKLENWTRKERSSFDSWTGYWGPYLTPEEEQEIQDGSFEDDPRAIAEREPRYRDKYKESMSSSSTLAWIDDTYK